MRWTNVIPAGKCDEIHNLLEIVMKRENSVSETGGFSRKRTKIQ
jgi:hypothetical protein